MRAWWSSLPLTLCGLSLAGCPSRPSDRVADGSTTTTIPSAPATTSTATASGAAVTATATSSAQPAGIVGTWRSPACGERKYERVIVLSADGRFAAQDRVSPCPAGASCVWSGIVERKGSYELKDEVVTLHVAEPPARGPGAALPPTLALRAGALVETAAGTSCDYSRR